jgi:L-alanine-DL-glutamate epimerase-like enolase superfamily enzyme
LDSVEGDGFMIRIARTHLEFDREPLAIPFGFKGGALTELWQSMALLQSDTGHQGIGLGVQSVLWSDPDVFAAHSEAAGNSLMFALAAHALRESAGIEWNSPLDLLDALLPSTLSYGRLVTERPDLRETFALNALVPLDWAAWRLYAQVNGITQFNELIPDFARPALSARHDCVLSVPGIGYATPIETIVRMVESGCTLLKIKLGADPDKDGDQDKMLAWDIARMQAIHSQVREIVPTREGEKFVTNCQNFGDGVVRYYLDANGRYDSLDRVLRLMDALDKMGALARVVLLEEPLPEHNRTDVRSLPVCVAADESAHTDKEAMERMDLGYGAIALKPIAKTLSMSFRIAAKAHARGVPCFCADLTVNPVMVDWNKLLACRLPALQGFDCGIMETNGAQNYRDWERMRTYLPFPEAAWTQEQYGSAFVLDGNFYQQSGGFFASLPYYATRLGTQVL